MLIAIQQKTKLVNELNKALGWELRAHALYAHYAAYVRGMESDRWESHFGEEASESIGHAQKVRNIIALLGGEAVTVRDATPIIHTEDLSVMLAEARKTEAAAAKQYQKIIPLAKEHPGFVHDLTHILMDEIRATEELDNWMGK